MSVGAGMFEPPACGKATIGGEEYGVFECRPCDLPALGAFIEGIGAESIKDSISARAAGKELEIGFGRLVGIIKEQPGAVCDLLASIFDPDPMGPLSREWRREKSAFFQTMPVSEITAAFGKWIEVNAPFLAKQAAPIVLGAARVLELVQKDVEERVRLMSSSGLGSA